MKRIFLFGMLAAFLVCGCKKNDEPVNPNNPDTPVADPEGTITANISETTHINVPGGGTIAWVNPNNFSLSSNSNTLVSICDMGAMKGLGNIVKIPETGYTIPTSDIITDVASQIGHGYVIKFERQSQTIPPVFVRLYVEEPITNAFDEILGVKVKYQYPFESTMLTVSADSLSFPANGGTKTLDITTDAAEWSYTCSDTWIQADQQGNKLSVTVASDEYQGKTGIIIITANERQQTVIVSVS
ncbi:MAG: BACON domain-containing protein, partial [Lentimicrobiaceae bacterium]|nr:BACON domain-containing protein [Lentimicrobiaceae bacterium]